MGLTKNKKQAVQALLRGIEALKAEREMIVERIKCLEETIVFLGDKPDRPALGSGRKLKVLPAVTQTARETSRKKSHWTPAKRKKAAATMRRVWAERRKGKR